MKLLSCEKLGFLCDHCGYFSKYKRCERCNSYYVENKEISIKKTLNLTGSSGFFISVFIKPAPLRSWHSYQDLAKDYRKYRKEKLKNIKRGSGLVEHYQFICRNIIFAMRHLNQEQFKRKTLNNE